MGGEATNKGRKWRGDGGKRRGLGWGMAGDGIERGEEARSGAPHWIDEPCGDPGFKWLKSPVKAFSGKVDITYLTCYS